MNKTGSDVVKSFLPNMPTISGIYKMIDIDNYIIYIGKAKNIQKRLSNYIKSDLDTKTIRMVSQIANIEYIVTNSEAESLILESQLIKKHQPKFNILLKDDKSFPYIKLRLDHDYPQLIKYRGKNLTGGEFFGPFASLSHIYTTSQELQKIFKLRTCSDYYFSTRTRPCLQYQIGRCSAPCTNKITKDGYAETVTEVKDFLSGRTHKLQAKLSKKMQQLSDSLKFEEAAQIRDKIKALSYIQLKSGTFDSNIIDADIIAIAQTNEQYCIDLFLYRAGTACGNVTYFPTNTENHTKSEIVEYFLLNFYQSHQAPTEIILNHDIINKKLINEIHKTKITIDSSNKLVQIAETNAVIALENHLKESLKNYENFQQIKDLFHLNVVPKRIEIYDNSHISGKFAVGSMVVATSAGLDKKEYRIFNLDITEPDDYAMLSQVLTRRFTRLKKETTKIPDLIIIDGGKGHLSAAHKVMQNFDLTIPLICMSKGEDRNSGCEQFHSIYFESFTIDKNKAVMKYLQILRDEAHNFAIKNHRQRRSKAIKSSKLDEITSIGKARKKALLHYFGSYQAIFDATIEELSQVENISKQIACNIFSHLHK